MNFDEDFGGPAPTRRVYQRSAGPIQDPAEVMNNLPPALQGTSKMQDLIKQMTSSMGEDGGSNLDHNYGMGLEDM